MNGFKLKAKIIEAGIRCWDVAVETGIPYSRLSAILNNRYHTTPTEIGNIEAAISRLSKSE